MTLKTTAESDATPGAVTRDTVLGGRVPLFQPVDGYRAAIDPVILAAAVPLGRAIGMVSPWTGRWSRRVAIARAKSRLCKMSTHRERERET